MDREAEITKRIELLKKKNELLMQRHKEIEADRKSAEKSGRSLSARQSAVEHQVSPGNHEKFHTPNRRPRAHMDDAGERPETNPHSNRQAPHSKGAQEPSPQTHRETHSTRGRGRGNANRNAQTPRGRGRGGRNQDYEAKRMENFRLLEEEMAQGPTVESPDNAAFGVSRFLDDPRRRGDLEPDQRYRSTRHKGSYGGLEFDNIKREMRGRGRPGHHRDRGRGRGSSKFQMSMEMTGRERQDQERWQAMREAADKEIMARSKNTEGKWRREWDAQKNDAAESHDSHQRTGHSERYDDRPRGYRGGRPRRGSGNRGTGTKGRGGKDRKDEDVEERKEKEDGHDTVPAEPLEVKEAPEEKETADKEESADAPEQPNTNAKPQRQRKKQTQKERSTMSPRHLAQQRAQTPSSKDGTEVWAQNSHHSDETGQEWINGAARSTEQWLPSDEGNRKPAIDERMLEQQEDGATVYSRQLGRGWGDEKNIKATKAWVIDTEKAGAATAESEAEKTTGQNEGRSFGKMHTSRKDTTSKTETSRLIEEDNDRLSMRSASPRLKRDNPGLTVEIKKDGGGRVKRYSEGDSSKVEQGQFSVVSPNGDVHESKKDSVTSPLSAGLLKTPEGMNWAEEMDMLSPTYEIRHMQLLAQKESMKTENLPTNGGNTDAKASPGNSVAKDLNPNLDELATKTIEDDVHETGCKDVDSTKNNITSSEPYSIQPVSADSKEDNKSTPIAASEAGGEPGSAVLASSEAEVIKDSEEPVDRNVEGVDSGEELDKSNKDSIDSDFKDARDADEEDNFFECDEEDQTKQQTEEDPAGDSVVEPSENGQLETSIVMEDSTCAATQDGEASEVPPSSVTSEEIKAVAEETVQTQLATCPDSNVHEQAENSSCGDEPTPEVQETKEPEPADTELTGVMNN